MAFQFSQTGQELQYLANEVTQLAGDYDDTASYAIGDYCNYQGTVYRCTAATTGAFDASAWTNSVIVMDAIKSLKARMTTAEGNISTLEANFTTMEGVSDNGWHVRKYPDGNFEAITIQQLTTGTGTAWGSGFYFHTTSKITMPSCAISVTFLVSSIVNSQLHVLCGSTAAAPSLTNTTLYVANAVATAGTVSVSMYLTGKWR